MITSHFAVKKSKSESTRRGNSSDFIFEGDRLKRGHTSGGESVINPWINFGVLIIFFLIRNIQFY